MLVELVLCPLTFCGAPSGSDEQIQSKCCKFVMTLHNFDIPHKEQSKSKVAPNKVISKIALDSGF